MGLSQYDRVNVPLFNKGVHNKYLCSMCGQYTTLHDSMSHEGYNLVCNHCAYKIAGILGMPISEAMLDIQEKGATLRRLFSDDETTI